MEDLEQVLADELKDAAVLRRRGHEHDASLIERIVDRVRAASEEYVTWLSESEAMMRSGRSSGWLRARFVEWQSRKLARYNPRRKREYREVVVPQRAHVLDHLSGRITGAAARNGTRR